MKRIFNPPKTPQEMTENEYQQPKLGDIVEVLGKKGYISKAFSDGNDYYIRGIDSGKKIVTSWTIKKHMNDTKIIEYLEDFD